MISAVLDRRLKVEITGDCDDEVISFNFEMAMLFVAQISGK
jgi:hypothetical protein